VDKTGLLSVITGKTELFFAFAIEVFEVFEIFEV